MSIHRYTPHENERSTRLLLLSYVPERDIWERDVRFVGCGRG